MRYGLSRASQYRAPIFVTVSMNLLVLEHVREYNKSWNFCDGMNEEQIESEIREYGLAAPDGHWAVARTKALALLRRRLRGRFRRLPG